MTVYGAHTFSYIIPLTKKNFSAYLHDYLCSPFSGFPSYIFSIFFLSPFLVWFGLVLWHINHCRLFDAKSSLYTYIKYIWSVNTFCW